LDGLGSQTEAFAVLGRTHPAGRLLDPLFVIVMQIGVELLDAYLRWYRDERLKSDFGYRSPMQYRKGLGLVAWSEKNGPEIPP
jgi:hypothetical protein